MSHYEERLPTHRHRDQRGGGAESGNYSGHQIVTCTAAAAAVPFVQLSSRWQLGCCTFCLCVCLKIDVPGFVFMMFGAGDTRHICYCPDNNQDNLLMPHFIGVHGPVNRGGRGDTGIME